jgi:hypothetical protein
VNQFDGEMAGPAYLDPCRLCRQVKEFELCEAIE